MDTGQIGAIFTGAEARANGEENSPHDDTHAKFNWGIYITLLMSTVGGGMLSIPYAFKLVGVPVGLIMLLCTALAMTFTAELLLDVHLKTGKITFQEFGSIAFGPVSVLFFEFIKTVAIWGCCIGYMTIMLGVLKELLPELGFKQGTFAADNVFMTSFIFGVLVFPLCLMQNINSLRYSSYAGASFSVYIAFLVPIDFFSSSKGSVTTNLKAVLHWPRSAYNVPVALGIFFFAYVLHLNVVPLYYTMRTKVPEKMRTTIRCVVATATFAYALVGVFGYAHFMDHTHDNVLFNFLPLGASSYVIARLSVCFIAATAFPLVFFPLRRTLEELCSDFIYRKKRVLKLGPIGFIIEVFSLLFLTFCIAVSVPGIGVVFGFTGSSSVVIICFLFPSMLYLKIGSMDNRSLNDAMRAGFVAKDGTYNVSKARSYSHCSSSSGDQNDYIDYATFDGLYDDVASEYNADDAAMRRARVGLSGIQRKYDWKKHASIFVGVVGLFTGCVCTYCTIAGKAVE
jgi:sodium-coupled neutral amino acid transporter 10